jgi:hypothetical protein
MREFDHVILHGRIRAIAVTIDHHEGATGIIAAVRGEQNGGMAFERGVDRPAEIGSERCRAERPGLEVAGPSADLERQVDLVTERGVPEIVDRIEARSVSPWVTIWGSAVSIDSTELSPDDNALIFDAYIGITPLTPACPRKGRSAR